MIIGEINKLEVKRISDIAYVLKDEDKEIFLHKKEADKEYEVGDIVECYIYQDSKRRVAASCNKPLITATTPAFLKVVDVVSGMGIFLDDGMPKDLLLSEQDIPFDKEYYPEIGDYLYVYLKTTNNSFRARLLPKSAFHSNLTPLNELRVRDSVKAYVLLINDKGVTAFTKDGYEIFINKYSMRARVRVGQELTVNIIKELGERVFQGTVIEKKELQMPIDSKKIYDYLKTHKTMNITDDSDPIVIYQKFQLSKSAFKRAIGHLYKEQLIVINDDSIDIKVEE